MSERIKELEKENSKLKEHLEKFQNSKKSSPKKWKFFVKFTATFFAGKKLKNSIYNSIQEFNEQKRISLNTTSDLIANLIKRLTRVGVIALLFALLPTTLMIYQNSLIKTQNKKIQEQTYLAEASRRSAQMFIMGDVLSDINNEIDVKKRTRLSNTLVGRIVGLSRAMKPYRYLVEDKLIEKSISPERGQLLITLCKSDIEPMFFVDRILQESDFTKSELKNASLYDAILRDINLTEADLSNARMLNIDARRASFKNANLKKTDFQDANLSYVDLTQADLSGAILLHTKLVKANMTDVILDGAIVDNADWLSHIKDNLKLKGAKELFKNYKVDSIYSKGFNKKMPTIVKKSFF
jgi:uncharacterized protein YjbI with pentapeptide repeats